MSSLGLSISLSLEKKLVTNISSISDISGLTAWYDASDSSTISTDVGVDQWNDKSGNGYHATQTTDANQPTTGSNTLNGLNVLTFDGTNDSLSLPSALSAAIPNTTSNIFIVARQAATAQERLLTFASSGNSTRLTVRYASSSSAITFNNNNTGSVVNTLTGFKNVDYNIIEATHSGTNQAVAANGSDFTSNSNAGNVSDSVIGSLGSTGNGTGDFLEGDIAEVIIYNKVLSTFERSIVIQYLYNKWGIVVKGTVVLPQKEGTTKLYNVLYDGYEFSTDVDMTDYKITPSNTYDILSNSGNTPSAQMAIGNATNNPYQINFGDGTYSRHRMWNNINSPTEDVNFIASSAASITPSAVDTYNRSGSTDAYFTTGLTSGEQSLLTAVYDMTVADSNGKFDELTLAASQAACESTAGTYFRSGSSLYIHASDSRDLSGSNIDNGILVILNQFGPHIKSAITGYIENINMYGAGVSTFTAGTSQDITTTGYNLYYNGGNVGYNTSTSGNGISIINAGIAVLKDVNVYDSQLDGINNHYYLDVGVLPQHHEINCKVYGAGKTNASNNNASTMHDGVYSERIGCVYDDAESRTVHDIDAGTFSILVGCKASNPRGLEDVNYVCGTGTGETIMYLLNCTSEGAGNDLICAANSKMFVTPASRLLDGNNTIDGQLNIYKPIIQFS